MSKTDRDFHHYNISQAPNSTRGEIMLNGEPDYIVFILRLYRVRGQPENQPSPTEKVWRVSLDNPRTHQRCGFASLEELFEFLSAQIEISSDVNIVDNEEL